MVNRCFVELGILEQPGGPVHILSTKAYSNVLGGLAASLSSISNLK